MPGTVRQFSETLLPEVSNKTDGYQGRSSGLPQLIVPSRFIHYCISRGEYNPSDTDILLCSTIGGQQWPITTSFKEITAAGAAPEFSEISESPDSLLGFCTFKPP
jgi:hypothetical protein